MKKSIIFLLVVVGSIATATAQKGAAAFFKTGYSCAPGASNIFRQIGTEGTPAFNNSYLIIGLELYYRANKSIFAWEGYSQEQPANSFGNHPSVPFLAATHFKFGRVINENRQRWLYPSIGVGAAVIDLADYKRLNNKPDNGTVSINRMLITPSFDAAINEDLLVGKALPSEKRYGGLIVGLRAGYRASFSSNAWLDGDWNKLRNLPSYSNSCFYLSVSIGSGGFVRR